MEWRLVVIKGNEDVVDAGGDSRTCLWILCYVYLCHGIVIKYSLFSFQMNDNMRPAFFIRFIILYISIFLYLAHLCTNILYIFIIFYYLLTSYLFREPCDSARSSLSFHNKIYPVKTPWNLNPSKRNIFWKAWRRSPIKAHFFLSSMSWYYKGEKNPIQKKQLLLKKSVYWIKLEFFTILARLLFKSLKLKGILNFKKEVIFWFLRLCSFLCQVTNFEEAALVHSENCC